MPTRPVEQEMVTELEAQTAQHRPSCITSSGAYARPVLCLPCMPPSQDWPSVHGLQVSLTPGIRPLCPVSMQYGMRAESRRRVGVL